MTFSPAVLDQLASWDAGETYAPELHVGDLGWSHRQPAGVEEIATWWEDDELVAVALLDDDSARPRVRSDRVLDRALAAAVADRIDALPAARVVTDALPGSGLRHELVTRGWVLDPHGWVSFWSPARPDADAGILTRLARDDVAGRVAVQRAGFTTSTFTEERWRQLTTGPAYRPDLDLVVPDPADDEAGAGVTAWLSVPGGTALIEPLATHPDHRGRGLGRQAVLAVTAACSRAGASGVSVATPEANVAGVATYVSAGFLIMESVRGLTRDPTRGAAPRPSAPTT